MTKRHLSKAKPQIIELLHRSNKRVYKSSELKLILEQYKATWQVDAYISSRAFALYLQDQQILERIDLNFPSRKEIRYISPGASLYELALTLRPNSYLSHRTAMAVHDLIDQTASDVYVNHEQSAKPSHASELTQDRLDQAFKNQPRTTNNKAQCGNNTVWLLNGMHTGRLGVVTMPSSNDQQFAVTNLERTLLDATVRPAYSGDIPSVLNAYIAARERVSIDVLVALLRQLNYVYPYHQAVGFYLERAGISEAGALAPFKDIGLRYDFYLGHNMHETQYSEKWRLHYPANL